MLKPNYQIVTKHVYVKLKKKSKDNISNLTIKTPTIYYNICYQIINQRLSRFDLHSLIYVKNNSILGKLNFHNLEMFINT